MLATPSSALGALVAGATGLQAGALASIPLSIPEVRMFRGRLETLNGGGTEAGAEAADAEAAQSDPNMSEFMTILRNLDDRSPDADFMTESSEIRAQQRLADLIRKMPQALLNRVEHAALYACAFPRLRPDSGTPTLLGVADSDGEKVRGILERSPLGRMETREILRTLGELKKGQSAEARLAESSEVGLDPHFTEWAGIFLGGGRDLSRLVQAAESYKEDKPLWSAQLFFLAGLMAHSNENPDAADYFYEAGRQFRETDNRSRALAADEEVKRFYQEHPEVKRPTEFVFGGPGEEAYHNYVHQWNFHAAQAFFLAAQAAEEKSNKANEAYEMAADSVVRKDPYFGMSEAMKLKWAFERRMVEAALSRDALAHLQSKYGFFLLSPTVRQHFFSKVRIETKRADSESNLLATLHLLDANVNGVAGGKAEENLQMARAGWKGANRL